MSGLAGLLAGLIQGEAEPGIYRWHGAVESAQEIPAIFKTTDTQAEVLMTRIAGLHSYDVPCITVWPIDKLLGNYADWVEASVA